MTAHQENDVFFGEAVLLFDFVEGDVICPRKSNDLADVSI